jgi:hypothetical protein
MMGAAVYLLGALIGIACAVLLLRGYRRGRQRMLLWSGLCFSGLALSNLLLFVDLVVVPHRDLYPLRLGVAAAAMLVLLYGLIWEE